MWRKSFLIVLALIAVHAFALRPAFSQSGPRPLISQTVARRFGLHRQWVTRARISRATDRVSFVVYDGQTLFVQSESGLVQAIDPESGGTRWIRQVGRRFAVSTRLASNAKYVALVSGLKLYVLDGNTGDTVWEERLSGVPGSTTALAGEWVYVPLITGMVEAYRFGASKELEEDEPNKTNWFFKSIGVPEVPPVVSGRTVAWATSGGVLYASDLNELKIRFRFEATAPFVAELVYQEPFFFAASQDGFLYAVDEVTGKTGWQFSTGSPISQAPIIIRDALYLISEQGAMYALSPETGTQTWEARGVQQFVAASDQNLYVADSAGRTIVLDAQTGRRLNSIPTESWDLKVTNLFTDRLFVGSYSGLIHCLREIQLDEPLNHATMAGPPGEPDEVDDQPADDPAEDADDPFGGNAANDPARDALSDANDPFSF